MDADRWQKINEVFFATFELAADQRSALLTKLCSDDSSLMDEISSLLAAHEKAEGFIQDSAVEPGRLVETIAAKLMVGRRFGPYRVVRKIDHGGMGAVFLAARDDQQYRKLVAIKIIRAGLDTPLNLRQFYKERQILANLEHPNIARLLDGGATEEGSPYLVMEYIEGQPIDAYCDVRHLSIVERLQLFLKVCSAVQYAHQESIIHRDIKPGNILVTAAGQPKLLDFGIAKLSTWNSPATATLTTTLLPRMTPEYASPEELQGREITAATDIYSLGILLYELLSGHRPYRLANRTPQEMFHAICQEVPEKPSASIFRAKGAERRGELCGERPERLRQRLAGDLDNIVLMAMRKEPQRRYQSVAEFAKDISRHLAGLPVRARKDTLAYRSNKFVKRNRFGVAATAMLAISLLVGTLTTQWQARRAELEKIQAEKQAMQATTQILGSRERARTAELEASHLRRQSEQEKRQSQAQLLRRLNQVLEAHDTRRGLVINTSNVIFNAGRVTLTPDARERLARVAGILLEYPELKLEVEGHTDNYGDDAYNQAISEERARAVQAYLISQGIFRKTINARGFGGTRPVASNQTEIGRQRNRRVEIIVSGGVIGNRPPAFSGITGPKLRSIFSKTTFSAKSTVPPGLAANLALNRPATGSTPCNAHEGPEKAFNGSVSGGNLDKWCSDAIPAFLQVDLGAVRTVASFVLKHASAGGEAADFNTRDFDIQISSNGTDFVTVVKMIGNTEGVTIHSIPPSTARFVRLNVTAPAQKPRIKLSRIYELEVYSSPVPPSTPGSSLVSSQ